MALPKRRNTDILLGAFVCFGVLLFGLFVFLIGKESRLFDRSAQIETYFHNVVGLSVGADVMLAGVLVGYVDQIEFPALKEKDSKTDGKIKVILRIPKNKLPWLRINSVARIDGKGLLGDKIINISLGDPKMPVVQDGGVLASIESMDFNDALAKAQDVLIHITGAAKAAQVAIQSFVDKGGVGALADTAVSIKKITQSLESGEGLAHRLIYSKSSGDNFEDILKSLSTIVHNTQDGQGTLGRLLTDPSLYDRTLKLLDDVERNRILKFLIRYSISQKEKTQDSKP